jgi:SpoIID/LytB domain protein
MGMSQWGAYAYAQHGWSAAKILAHYYPGTALGVDPPVHVRVLLFQGRGRIRIGAAVPWRVTDAQGTSLLLPAGSRVLSRSLVVSGHQLVSPLTVSAGRQPLEAGKRHYRGKLEILVNGDALEVINVVGLETYLEGVVGSEMPASWPLAALEAQAIAARSYALSQLETVVTASPYDLFSDSRSQSYGGVEAESPPVEEAVAATADEVLLYRGQVATTLFSASSGGVTVSAAEVLGKDIPYLVSIPDPYDTASPYHDWGPVLISAQAAGAALGLGGALLDLSLSPGPSDHVETATVVGPAGPETLSGTEVAADLGLRSTWFDVRWLALDPPAGPLSFGTHFDLTGSVHGFSGAEVEERLAGGAWSTVAAVPGGQDFSLPQVASSSARYRLVAGTIQASALTVEVAPLLSVATLADGDIRGLLRPALAGTLVALERLDGTSWQTVSATRTSPSGAFAFGGALAAGSYRVRSAAADGLAAVTSASFTAGAAPPADEATTAPS